MRLLYQSAVFHGNHLPLDSSADVEIDWDSVRGWFDELVEDEAGKIATFGQAIPSRRTRWIKATTGMNFNGIGDNKNEMVSWRSVTH